MEQAVEKINKTKEIDFHSSRVIWAIYDNKIYFTLEALDHREWLEELLGITEEQFETIKRGYIRRSEEDWDILNIVSYIGSDFREVELDESEINKLSWMADLIHECEKMKIYTGVEVGEAGDVWEPKTLLKSVDSAEDNKKHKNISFKSLIDYEDALVKFLEQDTVDENLKSLVLCEKFEVSQAIVSYITDKGNVILSNITDRAVGYSI